MRYKRPLIKRIVKESLNDIEITSDEVLSRTDLVRRRSSNLKRALHLGNGHYKRKVKLIFKSNLGRTQVETTVWGITEQFVLLKGGLRIPIKSIYKVRFY